MRHGKHGRKFSRQSGPRHALFSNLVSSLIEHERIKTTDAKAKELKRLADRTISWATSVGNLVNVENKDATDKARIVHAMRMAERVLKHKPTLHKLFSEIGPRLVGRAGGYTRVLKLGNRHGDAAPLSIIELVDRGDVEAAEKQEAAAAAAADEKSGKKKKAPKAEAAEAAPAKKPRASKKKADETAEGAAPKKAAKSKKKTDEE
jgi:large subunit ribosomal protein L17